ncbi:hypothetical protein [Streptomyces sp. NPDC005866]|uniref:hypothetical protein n=1 Tax=Streptomyces sp. NPDC005866 TaxID=3157075 RepID=UPI0033CF08DE
MDVRPGAVGDLNADGAGSGVGGGDHGQVRAQAARPAGAARGGGGTGGGAQHQLTLGMSHAGDGGASAQEPVWTSGPAPSAT